MRGVYCLCAVSEDKHSSSCTKYWNKDTMKSDIPAHLYVAKRGYISKSGQVEVVLFILYKLKKRLSMTYYFCVPLY